MFSQNGAQRVFKEKKKSKFAWNQKPNAMTSMFDRSDPMQHSSRSTGSVKKLRPKSLRILWINFWSIRSAQLRARRQTHLRRAFCATWVRISLQTGPGERSRSVPTDLTEGESVFLEDAASKRGEDPERRGKWKMCDRRWRHRGGRGRRRSDGAERGGLGGPGGDGECCSCFLAACRTFRRTLNVVLTFIWVLCQTWNYEEEARLLRFRV